MTDTDLETRIRSTIAADASRGPRPTLTAAALRDRAADVDKPARQHPARWRWAAVAAAAAVGAGVGGVVITDREGGSAFASWVSRPDPISAAQVVSVRGVCDATAPTPVGTGALVVGGAHPARLGRLVLIDRRGHTAYAVFNNGTTWSTCITTIPGLTPDKGLPNSYRVHVPIADAVESAAGPNEPLVVLSAKAPEGNSVLGHPITWVSGRVSRAVARVTVATAAGTVEATMHGGVYAAWWPGNDGDTATVRAYDSYGHLLSTIDELNCAKRAPLDPRIHVTGLSATGGCS